MESAFESTAATEAAYRSSLPSSVLYFFPLLLLYCSFLRGIVCYVASITALQTPIHPAVRDAVHKVTPGGGYTVRPV